MSIQDHPNLHAVLFATKLASRIFGTVGAEELTIDEVDSFYQESLRNDIAKKHAPDISFLTEIFLKGDITDVGFMNDYIYQVEGAVDQAVERSKNGL